MPTGIKGGVPGPCQAVGQTMEIRDGIPRAQSRRAVPRPLARLAGLSNRSRGLCLSLSLDSLKAPRQLRIFMFESRFQSVHFRRSESGLPGDRSPAADGQRDFPDDGLRFEWF